MKIIIDSDEWYPVYSVDDCPEDGSVNWGSVGGVMREVPDETVARWKRVFAEFHNVQTEIEAVERGPRNPDQETPGSSGCAGLLGSEAGEEAHWNKQPEPPSE